MQPTESADVQSVSADTPLGFRLEVIDSLFANMGVTSISGQARTLGFGKSYWIRLRQGQVEPLAGKVVHIAEVLDTSTKTIYGRAA